MAQSLLITCVHIHINAHHAILSASRHIALAYGTQNSSRRQIAIEGEEALEIHVQVLSDGLAIAIPAADPVDKLEAQRINRRRRSDRGAAVQAGKTGGAPEDIGDPNNCRHIVGVSIEDDRGRIEGFRGSFGRADVHRGDERKIVGGKMAVRYFRPKHLESANPWHQHCISLETACSFLSLGWKHHNPRFIFLFDKQFTSLCDAVR